MLIATLTTIKSTTSVIVTPKSYIAVTSVLLLAFRPSVAKHDLGGDLKAAQIALKTDNGSIYPL